MVQRSIFRKIKRLKERLLRVTSQQFIRANRVSTESERSPRSSLRQQNLHAHRSSCVRWPKSSLGRDRRILVPPAFQATAMSLGLLRSLLQSLLLILLNFLVACGALRALCASTTEESCLPKTNDARVAHSVAAWQLPRLTIVLIDLLVADAAIHRRNF